MPLKHLRDVPPREWLIVVMGFAPTFLFAYIGQFMRMMRDTYGVIELSRKYDPLFLVMDFRSSWRGSFGDVFLFGVLGPFDSEIVRIMPAVIIALWLLGLFWLLMLMLTAVRLEFSRITVAAALASLMLTATINGFYSLEALYWYEAAIRYALPLALAVLGICLMLALTLRCRSRRHEVGTAVIAGLAAFAAASFSEMHLVFQLTALPFLGAAATLLVNRSHRRLALFLITISWLATIANGLVQVTAPGIGDRVEWYVGGGVTTPIRSLSELIPLTMNLTFQYVTDQRAFAGFGMLFAVGLSVSLMISSADSRSSTKRTMSLSAIPVWAGLIVQACFVPLLWTHISDSPSVLGRFSYAYMVVICLNAAATVAYLALALARAKISSKLRQSPRFAIALTVACWIAALAFFALTQMRSIHFKAAGHLVLSAISVLGLLSYMFATQCSQRDARRGGALIAICFAATVVSAFVLLALANYSIGYVRDRVMAPVSFLLVVTGLVWGTCMGLWLKSFLNAKGLTSVWLARHKLAGALVAVTIGLGIFLGRLQWLPDLELYAREWDARHQYLLAKRDEGASYVEVAPLAYDMSQYFWEADISMKPENAAAERYYGIETIVQTET
ncbi:MAG: hypothetical protein OXG84_13970 [Chloroflexi bacterium]|nr:hypothetical protein [Chloroflexota bacterium]